MLLLHASTPALRGAPRPVHLQATNTTKYYSKQQVIQVCAVLCVCVTWLGDTSPPLYYSSPSTARRHGTGALVCVVYRRSTAQQFDGNSLKERRRWIVNPQVYTMLFPPSGSCLWTNELRIYRQLLYLRPKSVQWTLYLVMEREHIFIRMPSVYRLSR
jgi:hypothetical protein